jgi:hypothetical protein
MKIVPLSSAVNAAWPDAYVSGEPVPQYHVA